MSRQKRSSGQESGPKAPQEEVEEAVKYALRVAAQDGGFIMAMTNSHNAVKVENTRWMIEFTHRYGTYPLPQRP